MFLGTSLIKAATRREIPYKVGNEEAVGGRGNLREKGEKDRGIVGEFKGIGPKLTTRL